MAIDWLEAQAAAEQMKVAAVRVIQITRAVNEHNVAGRPLHADTLAALKSVDGPIARTAANDAWDALSAAMTP